jgi:protein TonB
VFTVTENEPKFPGGDSAWRNYLMKNLKANTPVEEGWKAGVYKIIVSFIVRKDGTIADIRTNDYPGTKTAEHCIELIRQGPKWTPALQNGHMVNAYKKQPIIFVVGDKTSL